MEHTQFKELIASIDFNLTGDQLVELESVVKRGISSNAISVLLSKRTEKLNQERICPHCQSKEVVKNGCDSRGRQRFRCRNKPCRKSFNILTNTPVARARKSDQWLAYVGLMAKHYSLPEIKRSGEVNLAYQTVFRWRHRFLSALDGNPQAQLSGIVEADETFFPHSVKGCRDISARFGRKARVRAGLNKRGLSNEQIPVVTALDNTGLIFQAVLGHRNQVASALAGQIAPGSLLCTDGFHAYAQVAANAGSEHRVIQPQTGFSNKPINKGAIGLGHVNAYHGKAKALINIQCRGVATKYLGNYMNWQRAMSQGVTKMDLLERSLRSG